MNQINKLVRSAGLLLAAGQSSRLGESKQLVKFQGKSLIRRAAEELLGSELDNLTVILGANAVMHETEITDLRCTIVVNDDWLKGIGSSIKKGMSSLLQTNPNLEYVIIAVCDQPSMNHNHLDRLLAMSKTNPDNIVGSQYDGIIGVPVLFPKEYFGHLMELSDLSGAKDIINQNRGKLKAVTLDDGGFDIDSKGDLKRLIGRDESAS